MSRFLNDYGRAVGSGNLRQGTAAGGEFRPGDTVAAAGLAAKKNPLGVALMRSFVGGDVEAKVVLRLLTEMLTSKAYRAGEILGPASADLIASQVLSWHRSSACPECKGHGFRTAVGELGGTSRVVMGDTPCPACRGTAKRPFDALFPPERLELALWLREKVEAKQAAAVVEARRALRPDTP